MKPHKMLVTKFNLKSKFKEIKSKNKIQITMLEIIRKMILKWKEILMEICLTNNKVKKITKKENQYLMMNKWEKLTINNVRKK